MVANSSVTCSRGSQKLSSSSGCADRHQQLQGAGGLEALAAPLSQTLSQHNEAAAKLNQPINLSTNRYQLSINKSMLHLLQKNSQAGVVMLWMGQADS
jgi:hypothetical protein